MTEPNPESGPRRFRPTFWTSVITLIALAILIGLGTWQVQRLHWKNTMIAERIERSEAAPTRLPSDFRDPETLEFSRVSVSGQFLHDQEMFLHARTYNGNVGFNVITPFELTDGRHILVNRGWVPPERKMPESRAEAQVLGITEVEGLLRTDGWKGLDFVRPDNEPDERNYYYVDIAAMAEANGLQSIIGAVYIDAGPKANPGGFPIGSQTRIYLRNDHLQYAITWYALAAVLAVIFFLYHYRREG